MKISYPLRDTSGKEFRSLEDVMRLIDGEAHGTWLLGANGLWHGGIHISDISNPFSALDPDAVNAGDPVPLQFMADGTIVAYRLNNEYLTAPYCGQPLRYSSSFVLVKSQCQPDPQREKVGWRFTACICIWPRYLIILHLLVIKSGMDTVAYCYASIKTDNTAYRRGSRITVKPGHILLRKNEKEPERRRPFCFFPDGAVLRHEEWQSHSDNIWPGPFTER
ncbi:hypothetical protein Q6239_06070 [Klebsiella pneumoniae]|uniref:hypothetical protein n=1 Tax=Klebsiella pneumoniae TaxID=573 RepID=UPI0039C3F871